MPERKSTPVEAGDATEEIQGVIERIAREGRTEGCCKPRWRQRSRSI